MSKADEIFVANMKKMKINICDVKTNLSKIIQSLTDGGETEIIIFKNGKPVAKMVPFFQKTDKRLGTAK